MFFPLGILWLGLTTWSFGLRVVDLLGISWVVASGLQAHANWDQNSYLNQLAGSDSGVDLRMHEAVPYWEPPSYGFRIEFWRSPGFVIRMQGVLTSGS